MKIGQDHLINASCCTSCGKNLDGAICVSQDAKPKPGDITICMYCGHIMAFGENLVLRELTDEEMYDVAGDEHILAVMAARGKMKG